MVKSVKQDNVVQGTYGRSEVYYQHRDGLHLGTIKRRAETLVTLERSIPHPLYKFGHYSFDPVCSLGRDIVSHQIRIDISDWDEYYSMFIKKFNLAVGARDKNNYPF